MRGAGGACAPPHSNGGPRASSVQTSWPLTHGPTDSGQRAPNTRNLFQYCMAIELSVLNQKTQQMLAEVHACSFLKHSRIGSVSSSVGSCLHGAFSP